MSIRMIGLTIVLFFISGLAFIQPAHAQMYYLALGDGISCGTGSGGELMIGNDTNEKSAAMVNMSQQGETTQSFIGIAATAYSSQLTRAIGFLRQHPGEVELVSLQLGLNNFQLYLHNDPPGESDISLALDGLTSDYKIILRDLKPAVGSADLVVLTYPTNDVKPEYRNIVSKINDAIESVAESEGVAVTGAKTIKSGAALSLLPQIWISADVTPPYRVFPRTPFFFEFRHFHGFGGRFSE